MKRANDIVPDASAWARNVARNSGEALSSVMGRWSEESVNLPPSCGHATRRCLLRLESQARAFTEPIMTNPFTNRPGCTQSVPMSKRFMILASGLVLGVILSVTAARLSFAWSIWPNRELNRSSDYVREVLQMVHENYVDEKSSDYDQLSRNAMHGMVESLDPHSEFLESKNNKELEEDLSGEFGGVGIQVETRKGKVTVIAPIAGTPGERAGILRGDEIVSIDGKPVEKDNGHDDVVGRLRGPPKTKVAIGLFRPSLQKQIDLTLVREVIRVDSVQIGSAHV